MSDEISSGLSVVQSLLPAHLQDTNLLKTLTASRSFLPSVKMYSSASELCKEGKFPIRHWGLQKTKKDPIIDLGKEPIVIPLSYRFKAIFKDGNNYLAYHNINSPEFKNVQDVCNKIKQNCPHMWGPEILLFMPGQDEMKYAIYFPMAPTHRGVANDIIALARKGCQLYTEMAESSKTGNKWAVPKCRKASDPADQPDWEEAARIANDFNNPVDSNMTIAEEAPEAASNRD